MLKSLERPTEIVNKTSQRDIKVLLVDDSHVVRSVLERMINARDGLAVVASTESAQSAIKYLKKNDVDVILLDIEMPIQSGIEALPEIVENCGDAKIMILSSNCSEGGPAAIQALTLGACDTLAKPGRSSFAGKFGDILADRLLGLGRHINVKPAKKTPQVERKAAAKKKISCIAIGASTGGIPAMQKLLNGLDSSISAPILVTQHLPESFMQFFAKQLNEITERTVVIGENGTVVKPNHIYVAPGHMHMIVQTVGNKQVIRLIEGQYPANYTPSVDPLFESVAETFGETGVGIILSGMGKDGLGGAEKMHDAGAVLIAQDLESSVVWGMPGAIARAGFASATLAPEKIATHLHDIYEGGRA